IFTNGQLSQVVHFFLISWGLALGTVIFATFVPMKKKDKNIGVKPQFERKIDESFFKMDQRFVQGSEFVYILSIILLFFGIMGLIWMIPFPELDFLVSLNMQNFLNWGSFYIAIVIYFYLRLAPTLSYAVLFTIGVMSFLIVQL